MPLLMRHLLAFKMKLLSDLIIIFVRSEIKVKKQKTEFNSILSKRYQLKFYIRLCVREGLCRWSCWLCAPVCVPVETKGQCAMPSSIIFHLISCLLLRQNLLLNLEFIDWAGLTTGQWAPEFCLSVSSALGFRCALLHQLLSRY